MGEVFIHVSRGERRRKIKVELSPSEPRRTGVIFKFVLCAVSSLMSPKWPPFMNRNQNIIKCRLFSL